MAGPRRFNPSMPKRDLDPWMTSAPGAFLTIRLSGRLEGVVTVSVSEGDDQLLVEAVWKPSQGDARSACATRERYNEAQALAYAWAAQLAVGKEPDTPADT
jgi:hypothetical protein